MIKAIIKFKKMLVIYSLILFMVNIFLCLGFQKQEDKLLGVIDIYRHGARSPLKLDKDNKDIFNSKWHLEKGVMTAIGLRQLYLQGYSTREKYILTKIDSERILGEHFDSNKIKIYSAEQNKSIESAISKMIGMFPPGTSNELNTDTVKYAFPPLSIKKSENFINNNDPIQGRIQPVSYELLENKFLYGFLNKFCKALSIEGSESAENKEKFREIKSRFENKVLPKLKTKLNKNILSIFGNNTELLLLELSSTITCNKIEKKEFKFEMPLEDLLFLENYKDYYFLDYLTSDEMKFILANSPMFNYIIEFGEGLLQKTEKKKYVGYSIHDANIGFYINFLKKFFHLNFIPTSIPYASNLVFEYYKSGNIYVYYNGNRMLETNFTILKYTVKTNLLSNSKFENFCSSSKSTVHFWTILFIFLMVLNLILVTIIIYNIVYFKTITENDSKLKIEDSSPPKKLIPLPDDIIEINL